jgi:alpha-glucosidase
MTNVQFDSIEDYNDVSIKNTYRIEREEGKSHEEIMEIIWKNGRDNSRTPMQWNDGVQAGFTTGTPWLKVNPNHKEINVENALKDPDSIYHFYKKLIELRKAHETLVYGNYDIVLEDHDQIYAYTRTLKDETFVIITNLFPEEAEFTFPTTLQAEKAELCISNYPQQANEDMTTITLRPYEARVYRL